jgi:hypothetical protein
VTLQTPDDALRLLRELGAPERLVRHHQLVAEAAALLCDGVAERFAVPFRRDLVLLGAALHDTGKILHRDELERPGHAHEPAGESLLLERGVAPAVARFCVTHASWDALDRSLEDLLVALADKLWKGQRTAALEARVLDALAAQTGRPSWEVFDRLDAVCEEIAADGPARLARSVA